MNPAQIDRLLILTVSGTQVDSLTAHLRQEQFAFTVMENSGGLLKELEVCLLVGFSSIRLQLLLEIIREACRPYRQFVSTQGTMQGEMAKLSMVEVELGGARLYMMAVEKFEQI